MGLRIFVYRHAGSDCTNGGVTAVYDELTLTNVEGPSEVSDKAPAAVLLPGHSRGTVRIVPQKVIDAGQHPMMGGNYAACTDARFDEAIEKLTGTPFYGAVAVHDRVEG